MVDDVTSMGGTLAELADYIQRNGGIVNRVIVLVNAGRITHFSPQPVTIKQMKEGYEDEIIELFGITPKPS